ncbi:MAG TPA: hypothetical protein DDW52_19815 [Planctomycetaceae bacterium]|nr:hypothetical protein [Planctomycetaceae bacterium]
MTSPHDDQLEDLLVDWQIAVEDGQNLTPKQICDQAGVPELAEALQERVELLSRSDWMFQSPVLKIDEGDPPESLDRYEIFGKIGEGGMGTVYRARHKAMRREVALKTISKGALSSKQLQRFQREIRNIAALNHVGIVAAYDALEVDGRWYLVMELVDGDDLQRIVDRTGKLPWAKVRDILAQTADAVSAAHQIGIVHRDIKPSNILLGSDGRTKLLDLGVSNVSGPLAARDSGSTQPSSMDLTEANVPLGTLAFMAPEQALDAQSADARSDIYSLGCTAYYLLSGQCLFDPSSVVATIVGHRETNAAPAVEKLGLPPHPQALLSKMLAKSPDDRFQTMNEVIRALDEIDASDETAAGSNVLPSNLAGVDVQSTRGKWMVFAGSVVLIAVLGLFVVYPRLRSHDTENNSTPKSEAPPVLRDDPNKRAQDSKRVQDIARWVFNNDGELEIEDSLGRQTVFAYEELPEGSFKIRSISLTSVASPFALDGFASLETLEHLDVFDCEIKQPTAAVSLAQLRSLESLYLVQCDFPPSLFETLGKLPSLADLQVVGYTPTGSEPLRLAPLPKVEFLQISQVPITDQHLMQLGPMPKLSILDVSYTNVGSGVLEFCRQRQQLEELDVRSTALTDADFPANGVPHLKRLYLGDQEIGENTQRFLSASPELQLLFLVKTPLAPHQLEKLRECKNLTELSLNEISLNTGHIEQLNQFAGLTTLEVSFCGLSDAAAGSLNLVGLQRLDVIGNPLTDSFLDSVDASVLSELDITDCEFSSQARKRFRRRYPSCDLLTDTVYNP